MPVYCSNFYGSVQCRGYAPRFGERCTFCTHPHSKAKLTRASYQMHGRGRPLQPGRLPASEPDWTPSRTPSDEDEDDEFDVHEGDVFKQALRRRRGAGTRVRQQLQSLLDDGQSS
ncbi:hypothetical protein ACRALDRAFT_1069936 [Sodiomyces alcalophilus JCM 7366]|uniref:uncharacterized protein n=1 Tax=Sodiomyces alcalophilus JCM 7366 TaxID=591952 RepID=UPI0039B5DCE9